MYATAQRPVDEMLLGNQTPQQQKQQLIQKNAKNRRAFGEITNSPLANNVQGKKPLLDSAKKKNKINKPKSKSSVSNTFAPQSPMTPTTNTLKTPSFTPHYDAQPETPKIQGQEAPGKMMASILAKTIREAPASKTRMLIDNWKMNAGNKGPHDKLREVQNAFAHTPSKAAMKGKVELNKKRLSQLRGMTHQDQSMSASVVIPTRDVEQVNTHAEEISLRDIIENSDNTSRMASISETSENGSIANLSMMTHLSSTSTGSPRTQMEWDDSLGFAASDSISNKLLNAAAVNFDTEAVITPIKIQVQPNAADVSVTSINIEEQEQEQEPDEVQNMLYLKMNNNPQDEDDDEDLPELPFTNDDDVAIEIEFTSTQVPSSTQIDEPEYIDVEPDHVEQNNLAGREPTILETIQVLREDIELEYQEKLDLELNKKEEEIQTRIQAAIEHRLSMAAPTTITETPGAKSISSIFPDDLVSVSATVTPVAPRSSVRKHADTIQQLNARLTMTKHYMATLEKNLNSSITGRPSKNAVRYAIDTMTKLGAYTRDATMLEQKINLIAQEHYGAQPLPSRYFNVEQRSSELAENLTDKIRVERAKVKAKEQETALRLSTAAAVATAQKGEALRELDRARRNLAKNESIRRKQAKLINDMSVSLKRAQQSNRNTLLETSVNETFIGDNVDSSINFDIRRSRASTSFALSSNPHARNLTQNVAPHVPQNVAPHGRKQRFAMITAEDITEDKMREALAVSFC